MWGEPIIKIIKIIAGIHVWTCQFCADIRRDHNAPKNGQNEDSSVRSKRAKERSVVADTERGGKEAEMNDINEATGHVSKKSHGVSQQSLPIAIGGLVLMDWRVTQTSVDFKLAHFRTINFSRRCHLCIMMLFGGSQNVYSVHAFFRNLEQILIWKNTRKKTEI